MLDKETARLLARKIANEASPAELLALRRAMEDSEELRRLDEILSAHGKNDAGGGMIAETDSLSDIHFSHILLSAREDEESPAAQAKRRPIKWRWVRRLAAAACLVALYPAAVFLFSKRPVPPPAAASQYVKKNEVMARPGVRSKIILPDGSTVWLNSDSKLWYNSSFGDRQRDVELEGEAYFDVVKRIDRPFVVHTASMDFRVLGTAFNVKSYPKEHTVEATLIRGSIEVLKQNEPKAPKVILRPHEKLIFRKDLNEFVKGQSADATAVSPASLNTGTHPHNIDIMLLPKNVADSSIAETSYVYNKLLFEGDRFDELAIKMERWFNVSILIRNEGVRRFRFTGVFESESIEEALEALKLTAPFDYTITNQNEVLID